MNTVAYATTHPLVDSFDPALRRLILFLTLPLLFLPKVNLIAITGQSAGLRIDDFLLLCAGFLVVCGIYSSRRPLTTVESLFGCFLFSATLSVILNWISFYLGILNAAASPLHVLRLIEYFTFFYVGGLLLEHRTTLSLLAWLFFVNVVVVILQWFDVVGGFTVDGYMSSVSSQPMGITAGHWEIGFVFNLLYAVFLMRGFPRTPVVLPLWILANFAIVVLTGCRSGLLGMIAVTGYYAGRRVLFYIGLFVSVLLGCLVLFPILYNLTLMERSQHLLTFENVWAFLEFFNRFDIGDSSFQELYASADPLGEPEIDMSWFYRIYKWSYVIKYYVTHPFHYLFGLGPGIFGIAMDGGLLRLVTEYGIVGAALYLCMLFRASGGSSVLIACSLAFLVNSVFLDMFLAYKGMSLYFVLLGAFSNQKRREGLT